MLERSLDLLTRIHGCHTVVLYGSHARGDATPASDYVRALADARYGYGTAGPTRAQRAALRRELGAGLGRRGRLRAWWALPPKLARPTR